MSHIGINYQIPIKFPLFKSLPKQILFLFQFSNKNQYRHYFKDPLKNNYSKIDIPNNSRSSCVKNSVSIPIVCLILKINN